MISYATKNTLKILGLIFSHLFKIKRLFSPGVKSERAHVSSLQQIWVGLVVFSDLVVYRVQMLADSCPPEFAESLPWEKKSDLNLLKSIIRLISRCLFRLPQTSYNSSIEPDVYMSQ